MDDSTTNAKSDGTTQQRWPEEEWIPISALEHFSYCPRQCALIHVEQVFEENLFTLRGRRAHEKADEAGVDTERGVRIERALPLWSEKYGMTGRADVVEFHPDGRILPVEYKHGPRRERRHDDLQLCAQALCLEEMLGRPVVEGAIYSISTHRRRVVALTDELREETLETLAAVRELFRQTGPLPEAVNDKRCPRCSLIDACFPAVVVAARQEKLRKALFVADAVERLGLAPHLAAL